MPRVSTAHTLLVIGIQTVALFFMDLMTPLGIVVWVLYLIPTGLTAWLPQRRAPIAAASIFSVLLLIGYHWGSSSFLPSQEPAALIHRAIALGLLWAMAILLYRYKHQLTARLEAEVNKRHVLEEQLRVSEASLAAERQRQIPEKIRGKVRRQQDRYLIQRNRDFESAMQITEMMLRQTSEDALLQETLDSAVRLVNAEAGSILTYDDTGHNLVFRAVVGPNAPVIRGMTIPSDAGIAGAVLAVGMPEVISDAREDRRHDASLDLRTGFRTRSLVVLPLKLKGEDAVGVMELLNKTTGLFDQADLQALKPLVTLLTAAIEQLRIYGDQPREPNGWPGGTDSVNEAC
jgi:signal transduction protein with GAF and PtsI domain